MASRWWVGLMASLITLPACMLDFDKFLSHDDGGGGQGGEGQSSSVTTTGSSTVTTSSTGGGGTGGGPAVCGDGTKNGSEACDGSDLDGQDCESIPGGYIGGTLACLNDCSGFDTSFCTVPPSCGDTVCNNGETCASCPGDCGACCGNGALDSGEKCDGSDLDGQDCTTIPGGYVSGTLACKADCTFNTTACNLPSCGDTICNNGETCASCPGDCGVCCGNGMINGTEACDGANLNGKSCTTIPGGFIGGTLTCKSDCTFNTMACTAGPNCGDGTCNNGETCASCPGDCGVCCGNGMINAGESCDGSNLNSQTCTTIPGGFNSGTLSCAANCTFNTGMCHLPPPTCTAGAAGTVDTITASGALETAFYLHFAAGGDFFSTTSPTTHAFTGATLPGQLVLVGKDGAQFDLKNGATVVSKVFYLVAGPFPSPQCDGSGLTTQACGAAVAQSFRCQFPPYLDSVGCPANAPVFTAQPANNTFSESNAGYQMILVNLSCP